jgi:hypothetical protein
MYIKGKSIDQIVGFKAGQTVGLHLRQKSDSLHVLAYYIDGQEVCEAFLPEELPQGLQGKTSTLHLAVSNGWAGATRVSVTARAPPGVV